MRRIIFAFALSVGTAAGIGITSGGPLRGVATGDVTAAEPYATGAELFAQNCAACHGAKGDGDGPAAAALDPKPRKLSDKATMAKISDETIIATIKKGGQAMGKSPVMPAFTQLDDGQVKSLLAHVRALCGCSFTK